MKRCMLTITLLLLWGCMGGEGRERARSTDAPWKAPKESAQRAADRVEEAQQAVRSQFDELEQGAEEE